MSHFKRPHEQPFTIDQRTSTTILFGGLTWKHESLVQAAFKAMGYQAAYIPTPDVKAFQLGKEFGNNGQCNPTYFTVGNLIKYLQNLQAQGLSKSEICQQYVFFTAGACGPCRFGMYEAEYRLALRNAGFADFRVLIFAQDEGIKSQQQRQPQGLDVNLELYVAILTAISLADLLNALAYQIRPYEVNPGQTDQILSQVMQNMTQAMSEAVADQRGIIERWKNSWLSKMTPIAKIWPLLSNPKLWAACEQAYQHFNSIAVDRTRCKPVVKITGEFFAQTTEGDGNFSMFKFLEQEGAEVICEPVANWIMYLIHQGKNKIKERKNLAQYQASTAPIAVWRRLIDEWRALKSLVAVTLGQRLFEYQYNRLRKALGETALPLTNQKQLQHLADPYYSTRLEGGEGHLEVAKNIYYQKKRLAHMVLSLKPFGCMPSTQSDGAQSAVVNHYKDIIYLPVETSGEGEINAHSRVQMALGEAKAKAKTEYQEVLLSTGYSLRELWSYIDSQPQLKAPFYTFVRNPYITGSASNFIFHVAGQMEAQGILPQAFTLHKAA